MAISIQIDQLQSYLNGVMTRADHHANAVNGVSLALLGAVVWRADGDVEVREYNGKPANMIWFYVNENRYVLKYNHLTGKIEMLDRTHNGTLLHEFDNNTTYNEIMDIFSKL